VASRAAEDLIVALVSGEAVFAEAAVDDVLSPAAAQHVVPVAADDVIVPRPGIDVDAEDGGADGDVVGAVGPVDTDPDDARAGERRARGVSRDGVRAAVVGEVYRVVAAGADDRQN